MKQLEKDAGSEWWSRVIESILPTCLGALGVFNQSTLDAVYVYVVPWLEFPTVPSYPHYPQVWCLVFGVWCLVFGA